jgi:hypothetical protein
MQNAVTFNFDERRYLNEFGKLFLAGKSDNVKYCTETKRKRLID